MKKAKRKSAGPKTISREKLEARRLRTENAILRDELRAYGLKGVGRQTALDGDLRLLREFVAAVRASTLPDGCMLVGAWHQGGEAMVRQTAISVYDLKRTAEAIYRATLRG